MEQRIAMEGGGHLVLIPDGPRVHVEASRSMDSQGLYKVWLVGGGKKEYLLGTLAPENGRLMLRRSISKMQLEQAGCWPVMGAKLRLTFLFSKDNQKLGWYCEPHPDRLVRDKLLRRLLKSPMYCRMSSGGAELATPFSCECPVGLNTLFCLAKIERIQGENYLVWRFDRSGNPCPPNADE